VISYVMIIALVIAIAGGVYLVFDTIGNPIAGQQGTEFVVNYDQPTDSYQLIYAGDPLDASETDVLEVSNEDGQYLNDSSYWSDGTLEKGDIVAGDLNATDGFDRGDIVHIIRHEDATTENGNEVLVSESGGERLQSVEIRDTDLEDYGIEFDREEGDIDGISIVVE